MAKKKTTKKASPKKVGKKKPVKKKATKKAVAKKTTAKKTTKKKTSPGKPAKKAETKKVVKKQAKDGKKIKKGEPAKGRPKFTVSIGPRRQTPNVAPGVMIEAMNMPKTVSRRRKIEIDLTARELRKIKEVLILKRETLLADIRHQMEDSRERNAQVKTDEFDRAADVADGNVSFEVASAGREELEDIETALKKLAEKTYGECEGCGSSIISSRLKALPFATLCTDCREKKEEHGDEEEVDTVWGLIDADAEEGS